MRLKKENVERVANTEAAIAKLKADGFEPIGEAAGEPEAKDKKPVNNMTVQELKALAKQRGFEGYSSLTKEELLAVLKDGDADV